MKTLKRLIEPTPEPMKKIRNIATYVAIIGGAVLTTVGTGGFALPASIVTAVTLITAVAGGIAGGAQMAKKGE